jgi:hypothetical protein
VTVGGVVLPRGAHVVGVGAAGLAEHPGARCWARRCCGSRSGAR